MSDYKPEVGEIYELVSLGMTLYEVGVEITYIGDGVGCYKRLDNQKECTFDIGQTVFRPIRTQEQLELKEAIKNFCNRNNIYRKVVK